MYKQEKKEKNAFHFVLTADKNEFENYVNMAYEKTKGRYAVQGFRKGKAPRKVIEQNYGSTIFYDEALNEFVNNEYGKVLTENKDIIPVAEPKLSIKKFDEKGLEVALEITVMPEVELGAYTGLEVEKSTGKVDEKQVEDEIEQMRNRSARYENVQREAKLGDFVTIDFVGRTDGKEFDGGKADDYRLELGSGTFIPGFEDQIVGMNIGEKRTIKVKFPENYTPELKGKDAEFDVTLNKVEEKQLPELNDDFASSVSEFDKLEDLKNDIKKHLEESLEARLKRENEDKVVAEIVKNAKVDVPDAMAEAEIEKHIKEFEMQLSYQGLTLDQYFEYTGTTMDDFKKSQMESARNAVKTQLVLNAILKKEKIKATQEELDEKLQEIATKYKKTLEEYKKGLGDNDISYFENDIIISKLMKFLTTNNTLK